MRRTRLFIESADSGRRGGGRRGRDHGPAARLEPAQARRRDPPVPGPGRGRAGAGRGGSRPGARARPSPRAPQRDDRRGPGRSRRRADVPAGHGAAAAAAGAPGPGGPDDVRGGDPRAAPVRAARAAPVEPGDPARRPRRPGLRRLVLPERIAARLRELRSSGRSELLSATLAALHEAGWPLRPLAEALGISKQAVQARVRRRGPGAELAASQRGDAASLRRRSRSGGWPARPGCGRT